MQQFSKRQPLKVQTVEMHEKQKNGVKPGFKILQYYISAVLPIKPDVNHEKTTVLSSCLESNACILKLFSFTNEKSISNQGIRFLPSLVVPG